MGNREELKITIGFDKNRTTATLWNWKTNRVIKDGNAYCHPDDKFDPQVGAMIALARMFGDEVEFKTNEEKPLTEVEKDAEADGYNLCRYGYPKKSGHYKVICEDGDYSMSLPWSSKHHTFGAYDNWTEEDAKGGIRAWMTKGNDPVVAWKGVK